MPIREEMAQKMIANGYGRERDCPKARGLGPSWRPFFSMASAATCFRLRCGSLRRPPDIITQRFPRATPQVGQATAEICFAVISFFPIREQSCNTRKEICPWKKCFRTRIVLLALGLLGSIRGHEAQHLLFQLRVYLVCNRHNVGEQRVEIQITHVFVQHCKNAHL
jgi:hypothetical protein